MIVVNKVDAERIATKYANDAGVGPFIVDGSELDESQDKPVWRVFLGFTGEAFIDLPDFMIVNVDATSGNASHVEAL